MTQTMCHRKSDRHHPVAMVFVLSQGWSQKNPRSAVIDDHSLMPFPQQVGVQQMVVW